MPNFSSLTGLEVTEKLVGGGWCGGGFQVTSMPKINEVAFELL